MNISQEQAKQLFDSGQISQNSYDQILSSNAPKQELIIEQVPEEKPLQVSAVNEDLSDRTIAAVSPQKELDAVTRPQSTQSEISPEPIGSEIKQMSQTKSIGPSPQEIIKGFNDGYQMQQDAAVSGAAAGIKQANAEASLFKQSAINLEKQEIERQQHEATRQKSFKEQTDKLQSMVNEYGAGKIDPNRLFKDQTTSQKVLTGIGLFLGAFGGDRGNTAVKVIDDAINRDIEVQKASIEAAKGKVGLQQGVLASMMAQFTDERQAESAARLAILNQVELQTKQLAAQYKSPAVQAAAQAAYGQLELAKQKEWINIKKAIQTSPEFVQSNNMGLKIRESVPEGLQSQAWKELGEYNGIQQGISQVKTIFSSLRDEQSWERRVGSPVQSKSILNKAQADLFPVVKKIVGEKMTDSDARILIESNLRGFFDDDTTAGRKENDLIKALQAAIPERTPILSGTGLLPKESELRAPVPVDNK